MDGEASARRPAGPSKTDLRRGHFTAAKKAPRHPHPQVAKKADPITTNDEQAFLFGTAAPGANDPHPTH